MKPVPDIRVIQLIDSLEAGGAERMAVSYANGLLDKIQFSGLVTTRKEGALKEQLLPNVNYLFLNKKGKFDVKAVFKLKSYIKKNKVNFIHAHSSSFFTAILVKMVLPKIKIIWHDHYGNSEFLENRSIVVLKLCSFFFNGIISVNTKLKEWSEKLLFTKNNIYLPNFVSISNSESEKTYLNGNENKRIICLANLREQKNHQMIIDVAKLLLVTHPDWSFHLVGKDFNDAYSQNLKNNILKENLENRIYFYGSKNDISNILDQSDIGIITSKSEGLPVALLEYGFKSLPVVSTNVGEISVVITSYENGILVNDLSPKTFYLALVEIIDNQNLSSKFSLEIKKTIEEKFSMESVLNTYLNWLD